MLLFTILSLALFLIGDNCGLGFHHVRPDPDFFQKLKEIFLCTWDRENDPKRTHRMGTSLHSIEDGMVSKEDTATKGNGMEGQPRNTLLVTTPDSISRQP